MSDFLANPQSLFDIRGKVAIVTGASGAFGVLAAKVLAGAGAKVAAVAGNAAALEETCATCRQLGAEVLAIKARPDSEAACDAIVAQTAGAFKCVDILVVASGKNDVAKITDMTPARFLDVMDANVTQSWLMARAAGRCWNRVAAVRSFSCRRRGGNSGIPRATAPIAPRSLPSTASRGRWAASGIHRHHRQCHSAYRVPLPPYCLDVRGKRTRPGSAQGVPCPCSQGAAGRAGGSGRTAAVPRLEGIGFLHRAHSRCRRRLHRRIESASPLANAQDG